MLRFIDFIVKFKEYVILSVLIIISLALMSLGNVAKLAGFRTIVVSGISIVQTSLSWLPNPVTVVSENAALRDMNYRLSREVAQSRRAIAENQRLKSLLEFRDSVNYTTRPAQIIGKITDKTRYFLTLNAGINDSVRTGMAVLNDKGLVGFVYSASKHYAVVQTILDRDTRIAAKIQRSHVNGILSWDGGEILRLKNISKTDSVYVGDIIVSSDYSSRYPADIPIGRIAEIREEPNTLFWYLRIEPAVHFASLEHVVVWLQQPDPERILLEEAVEKKTPKRDAGTR